MLPETSFCLSYCPQGFSGDSVCTGTSNQRDVIMYGTISDTTPGEHVPCSMKDRGMHFNGS